MKNSRLALGFSVMTVVPLLQLGTEYLGTGDRGRTLSKLAVTLIERRPSFLNHLEWTSVPKAKFRYSPAKGVWSLYWPDTNQRWHRLSSAKTAKDIRVLLKAVATDTSGVFWV